MKLFLIGGFLGSGKTTAIQEACAVLLEEGIKVGVVTNDQGVQLVDTGFLRSADLPVTEVQNGCFCCNYSRLEDCIQTLKESYQPEVVFAESVGSCTDLVATVFKPMLKFHPDIDVLISVFGDARVLPVLLKGSRLFAVSVNYIYKKQLEEADVIVVNKVDLITEAQLKEIRHLMKTRFPDKIILYQNSLIPQDVDAWIAVQINFRRLTGKKSLDIDYDIYGAGEAALAWLDEEIEIHCEEGNSGDAAARLINAIYSRTSRKELPIGHLKFLVSDGRRREKISFTTINGKDFVYKPTEFKTNSVTILINARVQTAPKSLNEIVSDALSEVRSQDNCRITSKNKEFFQPGYPEPAYRIAD